MPGVRSKLAQKGPQTSVSENQLQIYFNFANFGRDACSKTGRKSRKMAPFDLGKEISRSIRHRWIQISGQNWPKLPFSSIFGRTVPKSWSKIVKFPRNPDFCRDIGILADVLVRFRPKMPENDVFSRF